MGTGGGAIQNATPQVSTAPLRINIPAGGPVDFVSYLAEAEGTKYWLVGKRDSFRVKLSWGTI